MITTTVFNKPNKFHSFLKKHAEAMLLFFIALFTILICSKSSPLYPLNDWDDANLYLLSGRQILAGKIPYADFYEQKGPIALFWYALLAAIPGRLFFGFFIAEVVSAFLFLYYCRKIEQVIYPQTPLLFTCILTMIYASVTFRAGGCLEEFALPLLAFVLYHFILKDQKQTSFSLHIQIIFGIIIGILLLSKYTLLGLFVSLYLLYFIKSLKGHTLIEYFKFAGWNFVGCGFVVVPICLWLQSNNVLLTMWNEYFYKNIFEYNKEVPFWFGTSFASLSTPIFLLFVIITPICIWFLTKDSRIFVISVVLYILAYMKHPYGYYGLPLAILFPIILALICKEYHAEKLPKLILIITALFNLCLLYYISPNTYFINVSQKDLPQYQLVDTLKDEKFLCCTLLDVSLYNTCDVMPDSLYSHFTNGSCKQKEIVHCIETDIIQGKYDYIVTDNEADFMMENKNNYELIDVIPYYREAVFNYYDEYHLYQKCN